MSDYVLFDRVRVVKTSASFNDYDVGDIGMVTGVGESNVRVQWEQRRFEDDEREKARLDYLYLYEIERVLPEIKTF